MTYKMLFLGDSYTVGEGVEAEASWPHQLIKYCTAPGSRILIRQVARTGWTAAELRQAIHRTALDPAYDMVSLCIGVNDQYRGLPAEDYQYYFQQLLDYSLLKAGHNPAHVLVLSIPDYSVTPFAKEKDPGKICKELDRFNAINKALSGGRSVNYVDITTISRKVEAEPGLLAGDGLHPSGAMYARWVDQIIPIVRKMINEHG